jgi:diguanylate cyclase (GGDEF)-like protein/PAS domain S-box-containing protein
MDDIFFKKILDNLYDAVYFCDWERKIIYWNKAAEKLTGYKAEEVVGSHCWNNILNHTDANGEKLCSNDKCPALKAMREKTTIEAEIFLKHKEGYRLPITTRISPIFDENGRVTGAVEVFSDNSAKLASFRKIEKLEKLAFLDNLTSVGNRAYSEIKINAKLEELRIVQDIGNFGLLFADIDDFKKVNDEYGHETGDRVLKIVAKTFVSNLREEDFVGRWGGEEFILIISNVEKEELQIIADKLRVLVANSEIMENNKILKVTVSIGATIAKKTDDIKKLVNRADKLMYKCKNSGKNCVSFG